MKARFGVPPFGGFLEGPHFPASPCFVLGGAWRPWEVPWGAPGAHQVRTNTRSSPRSPRVTRRSASRKRTSKTELRSARDGLSGSGSCGTENSGSFPRTPPRPPAQPECANKWMPALRWQLLDVARAQQPLQIPRGPEPTQTQPQTQPCMYADIHTDIMNASRRVQAAARQHDACECKGLRLASPPQPKIARLQTCVLRHARQLPRSAAWPVHINGVRGGRCM